MTPNRPPDISEPLLKAPSLALRPELNLASGAGILVGGLLYAAIAGAGGPRGEGIFGNIFFFTGLAAWILCILLAAGGVSRSVMAQLDGQPAMGVAEMAAYLRRAWKRLILVPLAFCFLALAGVMAQTFLAIMGAIPGAGPILYALSFTLGASFSVLVILALAILVLGFPLYPAALARRDASVAEVVRDIIGLVRLQPARIILVEVGLALVCGGTALVISWVLRTALRLTVTISHPAMGDRFLKLIQGLPEPLYPLFETFAGPLPFYFATGDGPAYYPFAGFLLGISFLTLLAAAFCYPLTLLVSGGTTLYAGARSPEPPDA
jgi:hypothetical protein